MTEPHAIFKWLRPEVEALTAYHVQDAGDIIKLDAMENPYGWPAELTEKWLSVLKETSLNRYPDGAAKALKESFRVVFNVPKDIDMLLGNGSDELIQMLLMCVADKNRTVFAPTPTFSMYPVITTYLGMKFMGVDLTSPSSDNPFDIDLEKTLTAIREQQPAIIFISYPNNPSGNLFTTQSIRDIIAAASGMVIIDEAYHAFSNKSFLSEINQYNNVLLLRTLSKMGLAGLRLGVLLGPKICLDEIDKVRLPYNINTLTQVTADFALQHYDEFDRQAKQIQKDREGLVTSLGSLTGITVYPSQANFILFRVAKGHAGRLCEGLKAQGVLIKSMHGAHPMTADCLRVTVGSEWENKRFIEKLKYNL